MTTFTCEWSIKQRVIINGCESIIGFITEVCFRGTGCIVKVSWFNEGAHREEWFYEWQLTKAPV